MITLDHNNLTLAHAYESDDCIVENTLACLVEEKTFTKLDHY